MPGTVKGSAVRAFILSFLSCVYFPASAMDFGSGVDTESIIQQKLQQEAQSIQKHEQEIEEAKQKKKELQAFQNIISELKDKASELYGFRASFGERDAVSSAPDIVDASASHHASPGTRNVEVKQLASSHQISSDRFPDDHEFEPGNFEIEVGGQTRVVDFRGGPLSALREIIEEKASDLVSTDMMRTAGRDHLVTLESRQSGENSEILLRGGEELLREAGFIKDTVSDEQEKLELLFERRFFSDYEGGNAVDNMDGKLEISADGREAKMSGVLWQSYRLKEENVEIKEGTILEFDTVYSENENRKDVPERVEVGPEERVSIKGIELEGYNVPRVRSEDRDERRDFDSTLGAGLIYEDNGVLKELIYPIQKGAEGKQKIPVGKKIEGKKPVSVVFYCNEGTAVFNDVKFKTPVDIEDAAEIKNTISEAGSAEVEVDGIPVKRDDNNELTDVIEGVSLDLKRSSDEIVTINIDHDEGKAVDKIRDFVESYNTYIDKHQSLVKAEISDNPEGIHRQGQNKDRGSQGGLFVGDTTLLRLESSVQTTISDSYTSRAERPVRLLTELGVSFGELNADWQSIKDGRLSIDERRLTGILEENPEGVEMFFGADTTGDGRTDSGMAYTLVEILDQYVSPGQNIISAKIELKDSTIDDANDRIEKEYRHLEALEERLRAKYGEMERSIMESQQQQQRMQQQAPQPQAPGGQ